MKKKFILKKTNQLNDAEMRDIVGGGRIVGTFPEREFICSGFANEPCIYIEGGDWDCWTHFPKNPKCYPSGEAYRGICENGQCVPTTTFPPTPTPGIEEYI